MGSYKQVHDLQQEEGLRLANKLKRDHLEFASQKNEGKPVSPNVKGELQQKTKI